MQRTWKDDLLDSLRISAYVFTLILLVFGCLYIRDQHWFEAPEPIKQIRTVNADRSRSVLVRTEGEESEPAHDPWQNFSALFDSSLQEGSVPVGELIDTMLDSELIREMFTEEEIEEMRRAAELGEDLFRQIMEGQKEKTQ